MRWVRKTGISRRNCVSAWVHVVHGLRMVCIGFFRWWDHVCKVLRFYLKRSQRYKSANTFRDLRVSEILWTDVTRWEKGEKLFPGFPGASYCPILILLTSQSCHLNIGRPLPILPTPFDDVTKLWWRHNRKFWKSPNFISSDRKRFVLIL